MSFRPAFALLLFLSACEPASEPVHIDFEARLGGRALGCSAAADPAHLSDLRFYLHGFELLSGDGDPVAVRLEPDAWQQQDLALIDLEDGSGDCLNGTAAVHASVTGRVTAGEYRGLRFVLGVPFERNHADPLAARPPLDDPAMHWHWRSGYKFLRAGVRTTTDGFWLHLGSTGCEGAVGDISGCSSPNRIDVELPAFVPGRDVVVVELAALLAGTSLDDGVATKCSSGPAEAACAAPFAALGLDHGTGERQGMQAVFRVEERP